jgi:hypothetical protein
MVPDKKEAPVYIMPLPAFEIHTTGTGIAAQQVLSPLKAHSILNDHPQHADALDEAMSPPAAPVRSLSMGEV